MRRWRIGRKLEFGQNRVDHVLFSLQQIRQQNFVLNKLRRVPLQIRHVAREKLLETTACFRPIFFQKRNLGQVKARIPKLRIDPHRFVQCCFRFVIDALSHQNHAAQILRFGQIRLPNIYFIELFQRLGKIIRVEISERFAVHCLQFRFGWRDVRGRKRTEHQDGNRRNFANLHAGRITTLSATDDKPKFARQLQQPQI